MEEFEINILEQTTKRYKNNSCKFDKQSVKSHYQEFDSDSFKTQGSQWQINCTSLNIKNIGKQLFYLK